MKILILASNPRKDLNLEREIRHLQGVIERSRNREHLEVEVRLAVQPEDLQGILLKHEPDIVHFCGHGTGTQGLVLQDGNRREKLVSTDALSKLFELCSGWIKCVVLNACYSEVQANAIVQHIDYAIGMNHEIRDDAAIAFTTGFYQALGFGQPIEESYKFGCNAIQLQIADNSNFRSTLSEGRRKLEVASTVERVSIPEHLKPVLKMKPNLVPIKDESTFDATETLLPSQKLDIQSDIDKALEKEKALNQYPHKTYLPYSLPKTPILVVGGTLVTLAFALILKFFFPSSTCTNNSPLPSLIFGSPIFGFDFSEGPDPGCRKWYKLSEGIWIEELPDGTKNQLSFVRETKKGDVKGIILKKTETDGSDTEIFIPDGESRSRILYWRKKNNSNWNEFPGNPKIKYYK